MPNENKVVVFFAIREFFAKILKERNVHFALWNVCWSNAIPTGTITKDGRLEYQCESFHK